MWDKMFSSTSMSDIFGSKKKRLRNWNKCVLRNVSYLMCKEQAREDTTRIVLRALSDAIYFPIVDCSRSIKFGDKLQRRLKWICQKILSGKLNRNVGWVVLLQNLLFAQIFVPVLKFRHFSCWIESKKDDEKEKPWKFRLFSRKSFTIFVEARHQPTRFLMKMRSSTQFEIYRNDLRFRIISFKFTSIHVA